MVDCSPSVPTNQDGLLKLSPNANHSLSTTDAALDSVLSYLVVALLDGA